jgi:hypothetical protein
MAVHCPCELREDVRVCRTLEEVSLKEKRRVDRRLRDLMLCFSLYVSRGWILPISVYLMAFSPNQMLQSMGRSET